MNTSITIVCMLLLVAACAPPARQQAEDHRPQDTIMITPDTSQLQLEEKAVVELDSSAYDWQDGFLQLPWSDLMDVEFEWAYSEVVDQEVPFPIFGQTHRALEGQSVQISGYVIPLEETADETFIILSAFPYSQCFFCGQAGPESVMDILPATDLPRLPMDERVTFRGRLRLNDDDLRYLNYILEEAEWVR